MTVEEIEIIVTAKVEEALKEFKKIEPELKKAMQEMANQMKKIDMKEITQKVQKAVQDVKNKIQLLKKSTEKNEIQIKVTNDKAVEQITQLEKEIDSLQKKITSRQLKLDIATDSIDKIRYGKQSEIKKENPNLSSMQVSNRADFQLSSDVNYTSLVSQADKLNNEIITYNSLLESAKSKLNTIKQNTNQTASNQQKSNQSVKTFQNLFSKAGNIISSVKNGLNTFGNILNSISNIFKKIFSLAGKVGGAIKKFTPNIGNGMKSLLKYVATLVSIKSIYSSLSSAAQSWLSSQNISAQQLNANIEYMKYAMGNSLAPVIEFITNLFYELLKAIQSVVYALFNVNIFANAGASAYSNMANSANKASKANKSLAGIHSEINNVSTSNSKSAGENSGSIAPSFDLSNLDVQLTPFQQKLLDFFKPLIESWNIYSPDLITTIQQTFSQIGLLLESVGQSFINIFENGTVYTILENILNIIGNITEAFANAWNYNGNGNIIIQNLANAFNNLLMAINNVVQSPGFQEWLNNCSDKFREITDKLTSINWQPLIDALAQIGQSIGTLALDILSGLVDIFKWLSENPAVADIIIAIAVAITTVSTVIGVLSGVLTALTAVSTALNISLLPLIGIITAIIAVIALIVLAIMNWDTVTQWLSDTWEWIKQKAQEIWNAIAEFFSNLWKGICDTASSLWNGIKDFFVSIWTGISDFFSNVWNGIKEFAENAWNGIMIIITTVINGIKNTISNILNTISTIWNNIWSGIKNTVESIWNGIWGAIKSVINLILSGIENFVNGIINGINFVLGGISTVANAVGSLIGLDPINLQLGTISLPRLAKGAVLKAPIIAEMAEYPGANTNPEIVTPQNIMEETFHRVLSKYSNTDTNGQSIYLTVNIGNKKIGQIAIDDIRDTRRRTGEDLEVIFR